MENQDINENPAAKSVDSIDWLDEDWLREVAEKNGIDCMVDSNDGSDYFECDFESLKMFAHEVGVNFIHLSNVESDHGAKRS